jgi:hypothetical protein
MVNSGQEGVGVWWQIHAGSIGLQLQHRADERWILMGEAIVFLACPGARFDVVDATDSSVPLRF